MEKRTTLLSGRLYSLDFYRGITMFLLVAEFTGLFNHFIKPEFANTWVFTIGNQFHHHPWHGLRFWDLIQPFFMFIVGVAIPFSVTNRLKKGQPTTTITRHALGRAFLLLLFGWGLYCVGRETIVYRFQNVLAQLSVTYLIAFLLRNQKWWFQLAVSIFCILITEVVYRAFSVEGFDEPFVKLQNFGTWLDLQYDGADMYGGWVSFNAIPTTAHTIWGVLAGQLLLSKQTENRKLGILFGAGLALIVFGYALDTVTPIIKRICTSSFILVSGGWAIFVLALSYGIIDVRNRRKGLWVFTIVGMNSLFIYLFAHVGGANLFHEIVKPFANSWLGWLGTINKDILTSLIVLYLLWNLCYWLYKRKIFIRI